MDVWKFCVCSVSQQALLSNWVSSRGSLNHQAVVYLVRCPHLSLSHSHRVFITTVVFKLGVEAEYSLFRNKSEPASALKSEERAFVLHAPLLTPIALGVSFCVDMASEHSLGAMDARDSLSSDIAPSSKHKGMRAGAMGIDTHNNRTMSE